jgi:hypothetical protein
MMSIADCLISTNSKEAQAHYSKMEPLSTRWWTEGEEDIKAMKEKSCHLREDDG